MRMTTCQIPWPGHDPGVARTAGVWQLPCSRLYFSLLNNRDWAGEGAPVARMRGAQWGKTGVSPALSRNGNALRGRSPIPRLRRSLGSTFAERGPSANVVRAARQMAGFLFAWATLLWRGRFFFGHFSRLTRPSPFLARALNLERRARPSPTASGWHPRAWGAARPQPS